MFSLNASAFNEDGCLAFRDYESAIRRLPLAIIQSRFSTRMMRLRWAGVLVVRAVSADDHLDWLLD